MKTVKPKVKFPLENVQFPTELPLEVNSKYTTIIENVEYTYIKTEKGDVLFSKRVFRK